MLWDAFQELKINNDILVPTESVSFESYICYSDSEIRVCLSYESQLIDSNLSIDF